MELSDIMSLVKAGFTKDEIMQMAQPTTPDTNTEPAPVVTPAQIAEPVPTPVAEPVTPATPAPTVQPPQTQPQEQTQPTMADVMQGIAKLTSAVQANAIAQSVIPSGLSNPPSAESMIAEIIRPTYKGRD